MKKWMALVGIVGTMLLASCGGGGGSAGDTGQSNALRMNPALSSVGMRVGYFADVSTVSGGEKPYYVLSSDPSVKAVLLDDGTLTLAVESTTSMPSSPREESQSSIWSEETTSSGMWSFTSS